jgi:iron complex transport system substrate-binding protein
MSALSVRGQLLTSTLLAASWLFSIRASGGEITDQLGRKVKVSEQPQRIVTLAPSLAELAADFLGADLKRLVGVSEYSDVPPALKKVASVGPFHQVNFEKILALKPDLVLATADGNSRDQIEHLAEAGIAVVVTSSRSLDEVSESMKLTGASLGDATAGREMSEQFMRGLARIRDRAKARTLAPRVLIQVGDDPLVVAGARSFISQAVESVGARNLYADSDLTYPRPSLEDVLHRNPDSILILTMGTEETPYRKSAARWATYGKVNAVREGKVKVIKGDTIVRPTLRLIEGMALLEKAIFGDKQATQAFRDERKVR